MLRAVCCAVLCCAVLCCAVLCCAVLCCAVLCTVCCVLCYVLCFAVLDAVLGNELCVLGAVCYMLDARVSGISQSTWLVRPVQDTLS